MLLSRETNELIGMGLAAIRELMETFNINNLSPWVPRYFIVDDSAAEQQAIESAFENEAVGIYLCKVHSMRTLTSGLGGPTTYFVFLYPLESWFC